MGKARKLAGTIAEKAVEKLIDRLIDYAVDKVIEFIDRKPKVKVNDEP